MSKYWAFHFECLQIAANELLPKWRKENPGVGDQELLEMHWNGPEHITHLKNVELRESRAR